MTPVLAALLTILLLAPQSGGVHGRVLDPQGRQVSGAKIMVLKGNIVLAQVTAADGDIPAIALPPGDYQLIITAPGFRAAIELVHLSVENPSLDLTVPLSLDAVTETVVVSASNVDAILSRVPDAITVIDRDELLARQYAT